jgi:glucose/arabinose dehydrogenase
MHTRPSAGRVRLAALAATAALLLAACAAPEPPAPQAKPAADPPPWAQGKDARFADSKLAPHPPQLVARPLTDLRMNELRLPPGFQIEVWAHGMANARSMTVGDRGTVFVGARFVGNVYAVVDRGDRREVYTIAKGLHRPNGVAFHKGSLYVAELSRILRYDNIENRLDNPPPPVVVFDNLPKDEPHGWKFIAIGPDNRLYIPVGAPCNICASSERHALIASINLDGSDYRVFARGVRNTVGFDWHPVTRELWFTDNGRDWVDADRVPDELNHAPRAGMHFGFPYCHGRAFADPEFGKQRACKEFVPPALDLGPHVAALGMRFYTGGMFPAEFRHRAFIARRGSWNRPERIGFDVVQVVFDAAGKAARFEPFVTGWLRPNGEFWGRPVDVQQLRDGSLLIADDWNGVIYRVTHKKK